jgi:hypothetical protein
MSKKNEEFLERPAGGTSGSNPRRYLASSQGTRVALNLLEILVQHFVNARFDDRSRIFINLC